MSTRVRSFSEMSSEAEFTDSSAARKHRPDYMIVLFMGLLMLIGLITIYAIGPQRANVLNSAYGYDYSGSYFFIKQVVSLVVALAGFFAVAFIPYNLLTKNAGKLLIIGIGSCVLLAIAGWAHLGIAQETLGATRWFNLGIFGSLQPAELLKFAMMVFLAGFLGSKYRKGMINDIEDTLIPLGILTGVALLFLVVIQKDFGTGVSLVGVILTMLIVAGINIKNLMRIGLLVFALGAVLIFTAPHRMDRIFTFLEGDNHSGASSSYQVEQAKIAIGTGGLFGLGIGGSVQSTGYLPEAINDSVFAIMGEIFGFAGLMVILALFTALMMRLLKIMDHLIDIRLKLLVAGTFGWFGSHVILNIASMIGIFPLTGITLPLLSFGGTSMVFIAAALGLVFQLSHYTVHTSKLKEAQYENIGSRRGIGRARNSSRGGFIRN
ncbi:FtsW/RodA/SpoVE family cell cycle protein [Candidatus Saccharibacteria bacterium]|nr:FtsW/RodA/SpoVE family cell cycle protein [Candidatus Saccharibacteria bacterium]